MVICVVSVLVAVAVTVFIVSRMTRQKAESKIQALEKERDMLVSQLTDSRSELTARLAEAKADAARQREELKEDFRKQMDDSEDGFRRQLAAQSAQFEKQMELFRDQLKNDTHELLKKRQEELTETGRSSMDAIVKPLNDRLQEMQNVLDKTKLEGENNTTRITTSIENMFRQTNALGEKAEKLSEALRSKGKVQGDWGESILEEILQASGMQSGIHYECQKNYQDAEGNNQRPDVIVHCPDKRDVIVDSKVTLTDYYKYTMATTEEELLAAERGNLQSVKKHVEELARKNYSNLDGNLQKMMLMFIPNEGSYLLALKQDSNLLNWAYERNVVIVNQTSLMLTLHLIDALWKNAGQEKNIVKIFDAATLLYDRVCEFTREFGKIEQSLRDAHDSYVNAKNKLTENGGHSVIRSLESLKDLGLKKSKKSLDSTVIDTQPELT